MSQKLMASVLGLALLVSLAVAITTPASTSRTRPVATTTLVGDAQPVAGEGCCPSAGGGQTCSPAVRQSGMCPLEKAATCPASGVKHPGSTHP